MSPQISKLLVEKIIKEPVKTFSTSEGSKKGDNVAGNLIALKVQTESGIELNILQKSLPDAQMHKEFAITRKTFRIENTFYSQLAPALESWSKSRGFQVANRNDILPIPKFFDGFNDDKNDYICMEDMRPKGYQMADKYIGLNFEETSLVLKEIGQYHAITYGFIQWEGEKLFDKQEFKILAENVLDNHEFVKRSLALFKGTYEMSAELIEKKDKILAEKLQRKVPKTFEECFSTKFLTDKKFFPVIIFGDFWINNILFKYGPNGSPEDVKFIDFQQTRRGNIYEDLQYFLFTSTTPEFRKKHLYQVLDVYFESFISTIQAIKCHPPLNFTRGKFIDSMFECYFAAFVFNTFALPLQLGTHMELGPPNDAPAGDISHTSQPPPPPQEFPPVQTGDTSFDELEFQTKMMVGGLRMSIQTSPRAMDRLVSIASEMADLKVI